MESHSTLWVMMIMHLLYLSSSAAADFNNVTQELETTTFSQNFTDDVNVTESPLQAAKANLETINADKQGSKNESRLTKVLHMVKKEAETTLDVVKSEFKNLACKAGFLCDKDKEGNSLTGVAKNAEAVATLAKTLTATNSSGDAKKVKNDEATST